jgi:hypothetical protein
MAFLISPQNEASLAFPPLSPIRILFYYSLLVMLQAGRSRVRLPMRSLNFFNLPNPSSHTMALVLTQPLT